MDADFKTKNRRLARSSTYKPAAGNKYRCGIGLVTLTRVVVVETFNVNYSGLRGNAIIFVN
ncbi:hypothetical protein GCM10009193_08490 [Shewanella aestuarii]|nr:hypothetical protein GCM10009193_08490 [Shewanella aestuarii]